MKNKGRLVSLVSIVLIIFCCVIMLASLFLPFVKATDDLEELLEDNKEMYAIDDLDMDGKDLICISVVKWTKIFGSVGGESSEALFAVFLVLLIILPVWMIIAAVLKQGLSVMMNNILFIIVFAIYSTTYEAMEIISKDAYAWSVGFVFYIICIVLISLASLALIVLKLLKTKLVQNYIRQGQLNKNIYQRELSQYQGQKPTDAMYREKVPNMTAKHADRDNSEIICQIKQYKDLVDQGIISEEDYNAKKKQLLGI